MKDDPAPTDVSDHMILPADVKRVPAQPSVEKSPLLTRYYNGQAPIGIKLHAEIDLGITRRR